nr:MAG TPA: hypothetical protein [Caudoviricetes sp.]
MKLVKPEACSYIGAILGLFYFFLRLNCQVNRLKNTVFSLPVM